MNSAYRISVIKFKTVNEITIKVEFTTGSL